MRGRFNVGQTDELSIDFGVRTLRYLIDENLSIVQHLPMRKTVSKAGIPPEDYG